MNTYGPYLEDGSGYRDYFGKLAITVVQAEGTISGEETWTVTYKKGEGITYETVGSLQGGRRTWILISFTGIRIICFVF